MDGFFYEGASALPATAATADVLAADAWNVSDVPSSLLDCTDGSY